MACVVILCHAGLYVLTLVAKTNAYCYLRLVYEFLRVVDSGVRMRSRNTGKIIYLSVRLNNVL